MATRQPLSADKDSVMQVYVIVLSTAVSKVKTELSVLTSVLYQELSMCNI